jgi:hypothetical protein
VKESLAAERELDDLERAFLEIVDSVEPPGE